MIIGWLILSLVVGFVGSTRKIGFLSSFIWSIFLSPLVGIIITFNSDKIAEGEKRPPEMDKNIDRGDRFFDWKKYDEALDFYLTATKFGLSAPMTHYKIARIYAIKNDKDNSIFHLRCAIKDGLKDKNLIEQTQEFKGLIENEELINLFNPFAENTIIASSLSNVEKLEKLANLFEKGLINEEEFLAEKEKILKK